ncbi:MAG TPA: hypothetical protein VKV80_17695 [Streptosporangiaceae bacterium]|nr:hypothetical protein [Streptosporangiaceae bacterium]
MTRADVFGPGRSRNVGLPAEDVGAELIRPGARGLVLFRALASSPAGPSVPGSPSPSPSPSSSSSRAFAASGRVMRNAAPCPGADRTVAVPPCAATSAFTIARPSPLPPVFLARALSAR